MGVGRGIVTAPATVAIVGAGFAGVATASFLAGRDTAVTVIERESVPGGHASGHCAGILRHAERAPFTASLVHEGAATIAGLPFFRRCGAILLQGPGDDSAHLKEARL